MSLYQEARDLTRNYYSDGKKHSIKDVRTMLAEQGIVEKKNGNMISNVLYQLKKEGYIKMCQSKGEYILSEDAGCCAVQETDEKTGETEKEKCEQSAETKHYHRLNLDMEKFILIQPQSARQTELKATVLEAGEIRLNVALQKKIGTRRIQVLLSRDLKTLVLCGADETDKNALEFTKAGTAKNREIADILKEKRIPMPASYMVTWNEEYSAWEGTLQISARK